ICFTSCQLPFPVSTVRSESSISIRGSWGVGDRTSGGPLGFSHWRPDSGFRQGHCHCVRPTPIKPASWSGLVRGPKHPNEGDSWPCTAAPIFGQKLLLRPSMHLHSDAVPSPLVLIADIGHMLCMNIESLPGPLGFTLSVSRIEINFALD